MEYNFNDIEDKWRKFWAEHKTFKATEDSTKEKFYVLDMFPYPSGAGLHVGHPLGYIASDIFARYKRLKGFNVLHPMGYDSFGLPAEQYAIQTGQHPRITTEQNIARYREQLDKIGFSFDWDREVRTSAPEYYKWTQWIFKQFFNAYYDNAAQKARPISELIAHFEHSGNQGIDVCSDFDNAFTANEWKAFSEKEREAILQEYRLAYLADSWVNWCPALGTVLANDEVVNGVSERGGHPVEQKLMRQWSMRIKAYAERLLTGLDTIDWTESIKDQQRNWIGKSKGASVRFELENSTKSIEVFTTRPDTIFGVSFMVLAPEHPLVDEITSDTHREAIEVYKKQASLKSERDRQADVKNISGQDTGAFAIHPFTSERIPIWIGDYVLASYGTGAVMAVPCGDQRDWDFATHFNIEIKNIFKDIEVTEGAYSEKDAVIANSGFLNDLTVKEALERAISEIEARGIGKGKTQYRLRDAVFSRQRYWGEPFPIYYKNETPYAVEDEHLPITLPEVDKYLPTEDGEPPLARAEKSAWNFAQGDHMEFNTMPGWAGSSWYFLRYMDPKNEGAFVAKEKVNYWKNVDFYIGGSEHATGHLLYARFWTKFLYDMGYLPFDEPFRKMINQGMILGRSSLYFKALKIAVSMSDAEDNRELLPISEAPDLIISYSWVELITAYKSIKDKTQIDDGEVRILKDYERFSEMLVAKEKQATDILRKRYPERLGRISYNISDFPPLHNHVDIKYVDGDILDLEKAKQDPMNSNFLQALFILEDDGRFKCGHEIEKMSKSKYNVQTPDELVEKFGADTLRMYEMFLGPLEQSKPWDTKGINGVHNFLRKLWRLFHDKAGQVCLQDGEPSRDALKTLHKTIKKIEEDLERFSFNTGVSNFMICVNELTDQPCHNKSILRELVILLSPYAPHICEELWTLLGEAPGSISHATFPKFDPEYLVESSFDYPVSFNGKMRFKLNLPLILSVQEVEQEVMKHADTQKWLEQNAPKKVIVVHGKIVNVVV